MLGLGKKTFHSSERSYPPEPHFNESRTLRSARRVVPLNNLPTNAGRPWRFVGALGAAILLGGGAALVIAYFQVRDFSHLATGNQLQTANSPQLVTSVAPVSADEPQVSEESSSTPETIPEKETTGAATRRPRKEPTRIELARSDAKLHDTSLVANDSTTPAATQLPDHADQSPADRWEERRLRRIAHRDRRLPDREDGRGLFQIGEIFEGVNRP